MQKTTSAAGWRLRLGRGRPPYNDILTPREWQVADLPEQGLTNEQIAARLGISHSGAKYHVSEILSKLGVTSRDEVGERIREHRLAAAPSWLPTFLRAVQLPGGSFGPALALGALVVGIALVALFAAGACGGGGGGGLPVAATAGDMTRAGADFLSTPGAQTGVTFNDPWAYCQAVGTVDKAGSQYVGPQNTPDMIKAYAKATALPPSSPLWSGSNPGPALAWRCANGSLMVCSFGANIPCDEKAVTSNTPTDAMNGYCAAPPPNVDASKPFDMPAFVTGHDTIWQWQCVGGKAVATKQIFQVDPQGYIASFWHSVLPVN